MSTTAAEILEEKIGRMGRELRASDLAAGVLRTILGVLVLLFVATLLEHWTPLGAGRWSSVIRWLVSLLVWGVGGSLILLQIVRIVRARVNPVYAAALIEEAEPDLKNSLINWVYLRRGKTSDAIGRNVFQSLEMRTARTLVNTTETVVIDRAPLIRLGMALGVLLTILCGYILFSPKNPFVTFARILVPWADIEAPTRVNIGNPEPGDTECAIGEWVTVTAEIHGLHDGESPEVRISTPDGRIQNEPIPMKYREDTAFRWEATVPRDTEGAQQSFDYRIVAGDAQSPTYHVAMRVPFTAQVEAVTYEYPDFTRMVNERMVGGGNLIAPEGTRVSLEVAANRELAGVSLEPEGLGAQPITMTVPEENPKTAIGTWVLESDPERPDRPKYVAYRLRAMDTEGNRLKTPPRYRIQLVPNRLPQIRFNNPPENGMAISVHEVVPLEIEAEDPDHGLRRVTITFMKGNDVSVERTVCERAPESIGPDVPEDIEDIIDGENTTEPGKTVKRTVQFRGDQTGWKLEPGDRVEYQASVWDLRASDHGLPVMTETRSFTIQEPGVNEKTGRNGESQVTPETNGTETGEKAENEDDENNGDEEEKPLVGDETKTESEREKSTESGENGGGDPRSGGDTESGESDVPLTRSEGNGNLSKDRAENVRRDGDSRNGSDPTKSTESTETESSDE
ncbi:MAG: hypothetical protein Q4C47_04535, partial [Planctomycetia bacterium]|nr:hypothetical protein [Planctomycetia bacterium]